MQQEGQTYRISYKVKSDKDKYYVIYVEPKKIHMNIYIKQKQRQREQTRLPKGKKEAGER